MSIFYVDSGTMKKFLLRKSAYICTLFVLGFIYLLYIIPAQFDLLDPVNKALKDFQMSDLVFSKLRDDPPPDTNIVLVNIGHLDRAGIAKQISNIAKYEPAIVGLDVLLFKKKDFERDIALIMALSQLDNLVMVTDLTNLNEDATCFDSVAVSHPQFSNFARNGYADMTTSAEGYRTVREFAPKFCAKDSTHLAFSVVIAKMFDSLAYERLMERGKEREVINFRGNYKKFFRLDVDEALDENADFSFVKGKIVLFGYLGTPVLGTPTLEDSFFTPLNEIPAGRSAPDMYGVTLHANIISMILSGNYIGSTPLWLDMLIAFIIVFLNVSLFIWIAERAKVYYDLITKMLIVVEVVILFAINLLTLLYFDFKLDLTIAIVAVIFTGDLTELYIGSLRDLAIRAMKFLGLRIGEKYYREG